MEIKIDLNELKRQKLFVATPQYGGMCHGSYTRSMCDLSALCTRYGIEMQYYALQQESLIQRARNYCADSGLRAEGQDPDCPEDPTKKIFYQHFMFIDSDIGFNAQDVLVMMALQSQEPEKYNILTGGYPKKTISWEKVKQAVDKGMADDNPSNLEKYVGDYVFNPVAGSNEIRLDQPCEILDGGTGFMMIHRNTFLKYQGAYPEKMYRPDHVRTEHFDGSREICAFFDCVIDPETKRYLSEDYYFTQQCRKIGLRTWLCPWIQLTHTGQYVFGGSLADLASIGSSATVDPSLLGKNKKK